MLFSLKFILFYLLFNVVQTTFVRRVTITPTFRPTPASQHSETSTTSLPPSPSTTAPKSNNFPSLAPIFPPTPNGNPTTFPPTGSPSKETPMNTSSSGGFLSFFMIIFLLMIGCCCGGGLYYVYLNKEKKPVSFCLFCTVNFIRVYN